jgi:hypothetical protein
MKTASQVLGIVGGALAILSGLTLILVGSFFGSGFFGQFDMPYDFPIELFTTTFSTVWIVIGILYIAGGGLGLAGGITVKNKPSTAGVLLIIGAALTFSVPLILAAIFALVKEKPKAPAYGYAPYPYPPQYPPYPPYATPYPPQNPQYPPQNPTAPSGSASGDPTDGNQK